MVALLNCLNRVNSITWHNFRYRVRMNTGVLHVSCILCDTTVCAYAFNKRARARVIRRCWWAICVQFRLTIAVFHKTPRWHHHTHIVLHMCNMRATADASLQTDTHHKYTQTYQLDSVDWALNRELYRVLLPAGFVYLVASSLNV